MIGKAVKNYFVNLKYFFTPLGTLALGLILGLSVLIPGAKAALEILVSSVQTTLESAEIDVEHLEQSLVAAVRARLVRSFRIDSDDVRRRMADRYAQQQHPAVCGKRGNIRRRTAAFDRGVYSLWSR